MVSKKLKNPTLRRIVFFFPFQLFWLHLRSNQLLLIFWAILFAFITSNLATKYGVHYLFLDPEYLGNVDMWSYMIMGFAVGGFIMAFNISSYIMNAYRFHFLATLHRPFIKYCVNNFIFPVAFVTLYLIKIISFQYESEFLDKEKIFFDALGFLVGILLFIVPATTYFFTTNKDIFRLLGLKIAPDNEIQAKKKIARPMKVILEKNLEWRTVKRDPQEEDEWTVETYMNHPFSIMLARDTDHYDRKTLKRVFEQNHLNAALFETLSVITVLMIGLFREVPALQIPAGASIVLACTIVLMLTSAIHTMLRRWSLTFFIAVFVVMFVFSKRGGLNPDPQSSVYGINYDTAPAEYSNRKLDSLQNNFLDYQADYNHTIDILNNWKRKNRKAGRKKPKLVIVCANGGGLRASLWTFHALQSADSLLDGKLLSHTQLMTGSSGGMVGAAYLRELYYRSQLDTSIQLHSKAYADSISQDMLNPIAFALTINDLFIRFQSFKDGEYKYTKDRGYALEKQLNANTNQVLNKRLRDYYEPEKNAMIPMMILTPSIINDGRTLYISPQPVSYLTQKPAEKNLEYIATNDGVEFRRFFKDHDADNLWFTSALRMSATFPYISPVVSLPSDPVMDIMDAGLRDNYGPLTALKFMYTFHNWIRANTSGVVIVQIRDFNKIRPMEKNSGHSMLNLITQPLDNVYSNIFYMQDYNHDEMFTKTTHWLKTPLDVIDIQLRNGEDERISLSWHLTTEEKKQIRSSINLPENQKALERLSELLK